MPSIRLSAVRSEDTSSRKNGVLLKLTRVSRDGVGVQENINIPVGKSKIISSNHWFTVYLYHLEFSRLCVDYKYQKFIDDHYANLD
jgi:hypothetical protein